MIAGEMNAWIILTACLLLRSGMKKKKNYLQQGTGSGRNLSFIFLMVKNFFLLQK